MRVLVTGITGFLGQHLAGALLERDDVELVGMARDLEKAKPLAEKGVEIRRADLLDLDSLNGLTRDVDAVVHLAALMRFHAPGRLLRRSNVDATRALLEDALQSGVDHFVYVSSTEAMGPVRPPMLPPADETFPCNPEYAYGKTKLAAEGLVRKAGEEGGLPATVLRPTGVYGPGDLYVTLSTVRAVARRALRVMPGSGDKYVHFTHVGDVVAGIVAALDRRPKVAGKTVILASDDFHTYAEMFRVVAGLVGVPAPSRSVPAWLARGVLKLVEWVNKLRGKEDFVMHASVARDMTRHRAYSNALAKQLLDFQPSVRFEEGMAQTIAWYREQGLI
ncbi:MAG: NAD-dependent epimerase/dehydratase family protein [Promethearchaeota archaeon]